MDKCAADHCNSHATKGSAFCLSHAIEAGGGFFLASALRGNLMPDMYYPAIEPPAHVHEGLMAKIKEGERTK
jgi:hypothetical protein